MTKEVVIYHLEMNSKSQLNEKNDSKGLIVTEAEIDSYQLNRFLYEYIGSPWGWTDKLSDSDSKWKNYVENPNLRTWVAYFKGTIAGYFELYTNNDGTTEIVYFGLTKRFIGKGFGGYLLSCAIKQAWNIEKTKRIYVHTCTLDHPSALENYQSRGFKIYKSEKNKTVLTSASS